MKYLLAVCITALVIVLIHENASLFKESMRDTTELSVQSSRDYARFLDSMDRIREKYKSPTVEIPQSPKPAEPAVENPPPKPRKEKL